MIKACGILLCLLVSLPSWSAVEVTNATIRLPLPGKTVSAGYFTLTNPDGVASKLINVTSPEFGLIELHTHQQVDGMMQMRQVEHVEVPAGATVHFQPGGLHLMLFRPVHPLKADSIVHLTLHWSTGQSQEVVPTITQIPIR